MDQDKNDRTPIGYSWLEAWFSHFVGRLSFEPGRRAEMSPENNTDYLRDDAFGRAQEILGLDAKSLATKYFVTDLLNQYIAEISEVGRGPLKIGMQLANRKVLVWVIIPDGDDELAMALLLAQSNANTTFGKFGFTIFSTIVQQGEGVPLPGDYTWLVLN